MASKRKKVSPADCWTVTRASAETGMARTTILSAIKAGHITPHPLGCGTPTVLLADVVAYRDDPPQRGYWTQKRNVKKKR